LSDDNYLLNSPDALMIEQAACRENFSYFVERVFKIVNPSTRYSHNWHIDCMAEYLTACQRRQIKRLIINIPPRALKSISANVAWPAFLLGQDPSCRIMSASYSLDLSLKHSVDCRTIMNHEWYRSCFPNTILADDQNEKGKFQTTARGQRFATSVGGTTTGEGGNYLIVDDPHSATQADSDTIRESQVEWFDRAYASRLDDKERDVIVIIMQRLHQKDLTGHLLAEGGWEHLSLPVIFEKPRTISIGKFHKEIKAGEMLHADRFSEKFLEKERKRPYVFAGQYMQNPVPEGGGLIKTAWFEFWPHDVPLPKFSYIIQSWDTAFTEKTSGDPSACCTFGVFFPDDASMEKVRSYGGGFAVMLIDCFEGHLGFPELRSKILEMRKYTYGEQEKHVDLLLVEKKASGQSIIQELRNANLPVKDFNPGREDKRTRLHSIAHFIENGLLFLPESKHRPGQAVSWAGEYINQLTSFPAAEHDEYVDCTTQAFRVLSNMEFIRADGTADDFEEDDGTDPYAQNAPNPYGS
jgi:predicted phage terminase large subunit-like protein